MALDTDVVGPGVIELRGIDNRCRDRTGDVGATGTVASLAADVPLGYRLRRDVVIHRVTAITQWARRSLLLRFRVVRDPPVGVWLNVVGTPGLVPHVPLRRQDVIVITLLLPVTLLPFRSVDKRHI